LSITKKNHMQKTHKRRKTESERRKIFRLLAHFSLCVSHVRMRSVLVSFLVCNFRKIGVIFPEIFFPKWLCGFSFCPLARTKKKPQIHFGKRGEGENMQNTFFLQKKKTERVSSNKKEYTHRKREFSFSLGGLFHAQQKEATLVKKKKRSDMRHFVCVGGGKTNRD
jgi:hypothetical protein